MERSRGMCPSDFKMKLRLLVSFHLLLPTLSRYWIHLKLFTALVMWSFCQIAFYFILFQDLRWLTFTSSITDSDSTGCNSYPQNCSLVGKVFLLASLNLISVFHNWWKTKMWHINCLPTGLHRHDWSYSPRKPAFLWNKHFILWKQMKRNNSNFFSFLISIPPPPQVYSSSIWNIGPKSRPWKSDFLFCFWYILLTDKIHLRN